MHPAPRPLLSVWLSLCVTLFLLVQAASAQPSPFQSGREEMAAQRWDRAIRFFDESVRLGLRVDEARAARVNCLIGAKRLREVEADCLAELRRNPKSGWALRGAVIGGLLRKDARLTQRRLQAVLAASPQDADANNSMAWLLAAGPDARLHNGPLAVQFARRSVAATKRRTYHNLDTLAAALARAGNFAEAVTVQKEALTRLTAQDESERRPMLARQARYERREAFVDPEFWQPPE